MLYPMKLLAPLKDYIWGGTRLKEEYHKATSLSKVAESWELSCHQDGLSIIADGEYAGMTLAACLKQQGKRLLGKKGEAYQQFPLLIKLIDAKDDLSVQVHPDDSFAWKEEKGSGKTEMWYVVDAEPKASLIYGVRKELTRQEFARCIGEGTVLDICNSVPVHKGDVFFIEAGTLHAIGGGILLAEIQQSSNVTYRIYDYGRMGKDGKPRSLHIDKALAVARLKPSPKLVQPDKATLCGDARMKILASCAYFTVRHYDLKGGCSFDVDESTFVSCLVLSGRIKLQAGQEALQLMQGESVFLPASLGVCHMSGEGTFLLTHL